MHMIHFTPRPDRSLFSSDGAWDFGPARDAGGEHAADTQTAPLIRTRPRRSQTGRPSPYYSARPRPTAATARARRN